MNLDAILTTAAIALMAMLLRECWINFRGRK